MAFSFSFPRPVNAWKKPSFLRSADAVADECALVIAPVLVHAPPLQLELSLAPAAMADACATRRCFRMEAQTRLVERLGYVRVLAEIGKELQRKQGILFAEWTRLLHTVMLMMMVSVSRTRGGPAAAGEGGAASATQGSIRPRNREQASSVLDAQFDTSIRSANVPSSGAAGAGGSRSLCTLPRAPPQARSTDAVIGRWLRLATTFGEVGGSTACVSYDSRE
ncbi:hypothetical protein DFH11DRAFT_1876439 [Phellopilus nigrolimitatus]|nr:hypothetical protein DFH11DRAFT_1885875 [Phellopilus nigrolimitatus]KAH8116675.1 hypothetical protein DFH11DRAFT_1876439 [Phellopilus nigrolimitatus]